MTQSTDPKLVKAYGKMAELTAGECAACPFPYKCCGTAHCHAAIDWARERYGVELPVTGHPTLPLMGPNGCTAAPHFRPICTVHTCEIASWGQKNGDKAWTDRYFVLRDKIEAMEVEALGHPGPTGILRNA